LSRMLPRKLDTGAVANTPYLVLPRNSSFAWVCLSEAGNLKQKGFGCARNPG
jgi:hypothetical protein